MLTVNKTAGDIVTKRSFNNYQLTSNGAFRRTSRGTGPGALQQRVYLAWANGEGYELQVLDSYNNTTYGERNRRRASTSNSAARQRDAKPGEWQTYDVVWTAPTFKSDGSLATPAYVTAFHNGVLVQGSRRAQGVTKYNRSAGVQGARCGADSLTGAR